MKYDQLREAILRQKFIRIAAATAALLIGQALMAQTGPQWKDRAEYDLYDSIVKDGNAQTRLEKLDKWKKDYPDTQFIVNRRQVYLATYQQLNRPADVFSAAKEILAAEPNNLQALTAISVFVFRFTPAPSADDMATAEKAASQLVSGIDTFFAADKKPQGATDAQWQASKKEVLMYAQNALGWIPMNRKEYEKAEVELTKSLQVEPNNAQVTYWLAGVIVAQKKIEKLPTALFHFARAAHYDGTGALNPEGRKQVVPYFEKQYINYHGDKEGIEKVVEVAKASALPPADWKIKSIIDREKENEAAEEENARKFPDKALWKDLKTALTGDGGQAYFESSMKGAALPGGIEKAGVKVTKFKGKLVSATPEMSPKELVLSISGDIGDVTLKLDAQLRGKMEPGGEIEFEGVASSYTKEPFMVVFDVEKENVVGWAGVGGAPVAPAPKKAAPAKKATTPAKVVPKKK
jgi:tetratricopeptide (TPR) repeat protein